MSENAAEYYERYEMNQDVLAVLSANLERSPGYRIETYGCQMNAHDSEKLCRMLENMGYHAVSDNEQPKLVLFNTCCVREHAELKVHGNVGALRKVKEEDPELIIAVCGCMMQQKEISEALAKKYPFIDIIFGTHNLFMFPRYLRDVTEGRKVREVWDGNTALLAGSNLPASRKPGVSAFANIMYGCNNYCTYCIVPYVRGRERSRPHEDILREVRSIADQGYKEIMLLGQNVNSYGTGLENEWSFARLLREVNAVDGIERIRFMTSHPKDLSDELIDVLAEDNKVCNQLHLPVQSGSTEILRRMNRRYTREQYLSLVERLRSRAGAIGLTTDVIVGFPGETQEQYEETFSLIEQVRYHSAYIFLYSPRKGTAAAAMPDQIPEEVKKERLYRLLEAQNRITDEIQSEYIGSVYPVLVESRSKRDPAFISGRTTCGRMVTFAGSENEIGSTVSVKITAANPNTLKGERV